MLVTSSVRADIGPDPSIMCPEKLNPLILRLFGMMSFKELTHYVALPIDHLPYGDPLGSCCRPLEHGPGWIRRPVDGWNSVIYSNQRTRQHVVTLHPTFRLSVVAASGLRTGLPLSKNSRLRHSSPVPSSAGIRGHHVGWYGFITPCEPNDTNARWPDS